MIQEIYWPEIFELPELIVSREPALLCADGLVAWANCMMGANPLPKNFGEVLVEVAKRLGMSKAPTADNLAAFADEMGWSTKQKKDPDNARLIKAAPKLLAACQAMDKCHGTTDWAMAQLSIPEREAIIGIRAALAEATGKKPDTTQ